MSRVLWIGDGGVSTGFGNVCGNVGNRLVTMYGHEVHVLAANYSGDDHGTAMHLYRASSLDAMDTYGQKRVVELLSTIDPDVVVVLNDPHVITRLLWHNDWDRERYLLRYRPVISYFTADGENLPEAHKLFSRYTKPVAMSEFGRSQVPGSGLIHHGIDHDTFRRASPGRPIVVSSGQVVTDRRTAKAAYGYDPDRFLILRVDRNGWRKDFGSTWKALVPIVAAHDDIDVHFHCAGNDISGGPVMPELWSRDMATVDRFHLSQNMRMPAHDLAALYNAADLFVTTSMGEGFGLTIAEAVACGVPVVAQDCSAITEVVGPGGVLVEPGPAITSPSGQDLRLANVPRFTNVIEALYRDPEWRAVMSERGQRHIRGFSWNTAAGQFSSLITDIHQASLTQGSDPGEAAKEAVASA